MSYQHSFAKAFALPALLVLACLPTSPTKAEDWPQWMGPNRDNLWPANNVIARFPEGGPKAVWRAPVAIGYAGPAVVGERLYLTDFVTESDVKISNFDRKSFEGTERVLCLDATTGKEVWKHEYPVTYAISYPSGPRCTPLVDGEHVYTLGAEGNLICFNTADGGVVWQRALKQDYKTNSALWGYASHPLIDGDKLLCVVGGEGSHTVAFDKKTGKELWRHGTASEQGYSPATIIEAGGQRQLIATSPDYVASLDPETGVENWRQPYGASNGSIIMTPLHFENYLYVGGYSNRNLMLDLGNGSGDVKTLFRDKTKTAISPVNVQPFLEGNLMYGMDQSGELIASEIPSGERVWVNNGPLGERRIGNGTAFIVKQGDRFFLFTEQGDLVIAKLTQEGYEELDRANVIKLTNNAFDRQVVWSAPAFANGRMYVRNDEECICYELTEGR